MTTLAILFGLLFVAAYIWGDMHRYNAECYRQGIHAHRAAAAKFIVEVRKLEKRNRYLERKRMWVTRRAWAKRSGYRALGMGRWRVML